MATAQQKKQLNIWFVTTCIEECHVCTSCTSKIKTLKAQSPLQLPSTPTRRLVSSTTWPRWAALGHGYKVHKILGWFLQGCRFCCFYLVRWCGFNVGALPPETKKKNSRPTWHSSVLSRSRVSRVLNVVADGCAVSFGRGATFIQKFVDLWMPLINRIRDCRHFDFDLSSIRRR